MLELASEVPLPIIAFVGQFLFVFLLGYQTANIRDHNYSHAFLTSFVISSVEMGVVLTVVKAVIIQQGGVTTWLAFALGGACGIVLSMLVADRKIPNWRTLRSWFMRR